MQISTRDGITCDQCGATYKTDFEYFSFDFREIKISNGIHPSLQQCWDIIKMRVVEKYSKIMATNTKFRGKNRKRICELSGIDLNKNYLYCVVVEVKVVMSGQPNICSNCQHKTFDYDKPCTKCNNNDFVRIALTETNDRILEFNLCSEEYSNLVNKAESIRNLTNEWTTTTEPDK